MHIVIITQSGTQFTLTVDPAVQRAIIDLREGKWVKFFTEALAVPAAQPGEVKLAVGDLTASQG